MAGRISMGTRREITAAVVDRYRSAGRMDKGRILDELCAVTGWHRKHAVRALASHVRISPEARRQRSPTYGATIRDALVALWEASDRICGKRLKVMRAGSGCLNNNSASISGASAGVRPPRGAEENRSRLDPGCGRQGSNAVVARCKSRDIDQSSFAPHRRFRRLADRPPRI